MEYIVTAIADRCDKDGNYDLEITDSKGAKLKALVPPKMEQKVAFAIQESQARRHSTLASGFGGFLVLEVLRSGPGEPHGRAGKSLLIETAQFGSWALSLKPEQVDAMIADLEFLRNPVAH